MRRGSFCNLRYTWESSSRYRPRASSASVMIPVCLLIFSAKLLVWLNNRFFSIPDRKQLKFRFLHFLECIVQVLFYGFFCRCFDLLFQSCFGAGGSLLGRGTVIPPWPCCKRTHSAMSKIVKPTRIIPCISLCGSVSP